MESTETTGAPRKNSAAILIVDDARLNREVLKLALRREGYRIIEADDGRAACELVQSQDIDLILLDLMMPVMDGFEFLEWRRNNPAYQVIPVIVNSALDDFNSIQTALTMDAYDYFTKPLTAQDLKVILPLKIRNAVQTKQLYFELKRRNERIENEIMLAGKYQQSLLSNNPSPRGMEVVTFYRPFIGVAGDFFDVVEDDQGVGFLMADVSGHGLLSAMVSSQLKSLFERYMTQTRSPAQTCRALNRDLLRLTREEDYVTAFCAWLDRPSSTLVYTTAGHPPQFFYKADKKKLVELSTDGFFMGVFQDDILPIPYREEKIEVNPDDRLLAFTDGSVEAMNQDRMVYGYDRWQQDFLDVAGLSLPDAADHLWSRITDHTQGRLSDDVAFLLVRFGDRTDGR